MAGPPKLEIRERRALSIVQVAAWDGQGEATSAAIEKAVGVKPSKRPCSAQESAGTAALWVGPERWLVVEQERRDLTGALSGVVGEKLAAITDQSHSRCALRLSGPEARNVLRKGTTLDMDRGHFEPGDARATGLFHISALIHCFSDAVFDLYVARSFAQSFFEVLIHAAAEYGYRVAPPS
jgi:sarcosine oxidase subunit gamma